MGQARGPVLFYFFSWLGLVFLAVVLNALNVNWHLSHPVQGVVVVVVLTLLEASACEFLLMTVVSITYSGFGGLRRPHIARNYDHELTLIINFNLLAHCEGDIDDAYCHMYQSFMTNLSPAISAVLLSATGKESLKDYEIQTRDNYRALIRKVLREEGQHILRGEPQFVDTFRLRHFWKTFTDLSDVDLENNLEAIVNRAANEFMCIHRVTRVLKKCGQYQDLFLLSEGEKLAFTYTDPILYDRLARKIDEPMFHESTDVNNIFCREFDYTLVMDNDTVCPAGTAHELLAVAAAHPERGIIQPAIKMDVSPTDTIYMHLEMWRQRLNEPLSRSMALLFDQWGFYGKGMINNKLYVKNMIGSRNRLIEIVPIDVLSHDTYEAAVLRPLYVDSLYFEEEPSYNYITWHIRERRWNQGELILSQYFWPNILGKPIGFLRRCFDKRNYIKTGVRTKCDFGLVSTHVAHSAIRSMFMKPLMLCYVLLQMGVHMHRPFLPLAGILFIVCIVPKFAITNWANARFAMVEMFASILQYTPEAFIGSVRLCQAIFATICKSCTENWTPQRVVEEDMRSSNPFSSSIRHLWAYSTVAVVVTVVFAVVIPEGNLIYFMFATIIIIPFFTGFTSLTPDYKAIRTMSYDAKEDGTQEDPRPLDALMEEGKSLTNIMNEPLIDGEKTLRDAAYYTDETGPPKVRVRSRERYKARHRSPTVVIEADETPGGIVRRKIELGVEALPDEGLTQRRRHRSTERNSNRGRRNVSFSPPKPPPKDPYAPGPSGVATSIFEIGVDVIADEDAATSSARNNDIERRPDSERGEERVRRISVSPTNLFNRGFPKRLKSLNPIKGKKKSDKSDSEARARKINEELLEQLLSSRSNPGGAAEAGHRTTVRDYFGVGRDTPSEAGSSKQIEKTSSKSLTRKNDGSRKSRKKNKKSKYKQLDNDRNSPLLQKTDLEVRANERNSRAKEPSGRKLLAPLATAEILAARKSAGKKTTSGESLDAGRANLGEGSSGGNSTSALHHAITPSLKGRLLQRPPSVGRASPSPGPLTRPPSRTSLLSDTSSQRKWKQKEPSNKGGIRVLRPLGFKGLRTAWASKGANETGRSQSISNLSPSARTSLLFETDSGSGSSRMVQGRSTNAKPERVRSPSPYTPIRMNTSGHGNLTSPKASSINRLDQYNSDGSRSGGIRPDSLGQGSGVKPLKKVLCPKPVARPSRQDSSGESSSGRRPRSRTRKVSKFRPLKE